MLFQHFLDVSNVLFIMCGGGATTEYELLQRVSGATIQTSDLILSDFTPNKKQDAQETDIEDLFQSVNLCRLNTGWKRSWRCLRASLACQTARKYRLTLSQSVSKRSDQCVQQRGDLVH